MTNPLTETREAVWSILDTDQALSDFMGDGRRYRFDGDSFDPKRITPTDCPCLNIRPGSLPVRWASPQHPHFDYTLSIRGVLTDRQASSIEDFFCKVYTALMGAHPDLGLTAVGNFTVAQLEFEGPVSGPTSQETWTFSFLLIVTIKQNLDDYLGA